MAYIVAEPCINCKYTDCVDVCPVDCFHEGVNFLAIHPPHALHISQRVFLSWEQGKNLNLTLGDLQSLVAPSVLPIVGHGINAQVKQMCGNL